MIFWGFGSHASSNMRISEIRSKNGRTASYAVLERSFQNGPFNGMGTSVPPSHGTSVLPPSAGKTGGTSVPPSAGKTGILVFPALGGTKEIVQLLQPAMDDVVQVPSGDSGGDSTFTISSGDASTSIPSEDAVSLKRLCSISRFSDTKQRFSDTKRRESFGVPDPQTQTSRSSTSLLGLLHIHSRPNYYWGSFTMYSTNAALLVNIVYSFNIIDVAFFFFKKFIQQGELPVYTPGYTGFGYAECNSRREPPTALYLFSRNAISV